MSRKEAGPVSPKDVARVLTEIATLMELNGQDSFRARAFSNAARFLEGTDADLLALAESGRLTTLKGVGQGIAGVIEEIVLTGQSAAHTELTAATPVGLYELLRVPGLGPRRIHLLYQELGVDSLEALEHAAEAGKIAKLSGFGSKTEKKILDGIGFARQAGSRRRYPDALELAARLVDWLRDRPEVLSAEIVGPIRRRLEVVDRIDLVAASKKPGKTLAAFRELHAAGGSGEEADLATLRLNDGVVARLRCVAPDGFVATVVLDTGSDAHVAELRERAEASGLSLETSGLTRKTEKVEVADEEVLYRELGLAYVPPELREGLGEIELAARGEVPTLVELEDLRGTFHCHTTFSDGKATLEEMVESARARGWNYLGIADHSRSAGYAGGLSIERVQEQREAVRALQAEIDVEGERGSFRIFHGIESDILPDGSLDYPSQVLETFDYVVGSVHSGFRTSEAEMTKRIVRAVENPYLTILGHPTGRLLLRREGYAVDIEKVIAAAAATGTVIEINANPNRLDLDWRDVRRAVELGVLIAVNPDAHSIRELDNLAFGINMARKAGLEPAGILNCWPLDEVVEYLAERKPRR